jgi:hypothetical protein
MDITTKWAEYRAQCMPWEAGPVQVRECELAFLAGAQAMIGTLSEIVDATDDLEVGSRGIDRQQKLIARRTNEILSD